MSISAVIKWYFKIIMFKFTFKVLSSQVLFEIEESKSVARLGYCDQEVCFHNAFN